MDRVIRKSSAQGFQINTEELFLILNYDANNLIDIGCDILIPSNFQNRLIPKSKVIFEIDFSFSDNHILDYDLSVIVKNSKERITMEQINQMVKSKLGIIEIGNKWVNFDVDEARSEEHTSELQSH